MEEVSKNKKVLGRLKAACEKAKRTLSSSLNVTIDVDSLYQGIDFNCQITRARLEALAKEEFEKWMATKHPQFEGMKHGQSGTPVTMK